MLLARLYRLLIANPHIHGLVIGNRRRRLTLGLSILEENAINVLETDVGGLRVEKVDDWHETEGQCHEDEVRLPAQSVDQDRRDHDDEEVPGPVGGDGDGGAARAGLQWQDFRSVDPGDHVDRASEDDHVDKEEGHGGGAGVLLPER